MAESFSRDTLVAFGKTREGTFNTASTSAGDYTSLPFDPNPPLFIPQLEQAPLLGGGIEFPEDLCNGYWVPLQLSFNPRWDFNDIALRFGSQAFAGSITATEPVASTAYKYATAFQTAANGANLPGRSIAIKNGNLSFLMAGNAVNTFALSQVGGDVPVIEVGILGTSKFTNPCPFTVPAVSLTCPAVTVTEIIITDSYGAAVGMYAREEVYSWRFELNNNADASSQLVRKGSDTTQGPTGGTGKFPTKVIRRFPRSMSANVRVNFEILTGASRGYWEQMAKRASITTVSLRVRGDLISGATYNQLDWIITDGRWTATPIVDNDTILAYDLTLQPTNDAVIGSYAVTNTTATGYS